MSQTKKILIHMQDRGSITALEAMQEYGCMRLAARIADLKAEGVQIIATTEWAMNRDGELVRFKRYFLKGDINAQ